MEAENSFKKGKIKLVYCNFLRVPQVAAHLTKIYTCKNVPSNETMMVLDPKTPENKNKIDLNAERQGSFHWLLL